MKKFILALFILYLPFQLKLMQIGPLNVIDIFLILLIFIFIFDRSKNFIRPKFEIALWLFLIIWIASFFHTMFYPPGIWKHAVAVEFKRLITLVLAYFVFSRCVKTKKEIQLLIYAVFLSLVFAALSTWKSGMLAGPNFANFKRSAGPFWLDYRGADIAGGFLACFTPFLLAFILLTKKRVIKFACLVGLIICALGIFTTYSRGSILSLGVASIVTILLSAKKVLKASKLTAFIILLVFIALALNWQTWVPRSIVSRMESTIQEQVYVGDVVLDGSSLERMDKWKKGIEIFNTNPLFGTGFKIPEFVLGTDTHNAFIQIAAEMGFFGFLTFISFLLSILLEAKALLKTEFAWLGIGFMGCMVAFIIVNMFYSNFFRDTVVGTFWILLGILVATQNLTQQVSKKKGINVKHE